jgi:rare lipoprotein A
VKLDILREGTTFVELRVLAPGAPEITGATLVAAEPAVTPVAPATPVTPAMPVERQTWAQVGAFSDAANVDRVLQRLASVGLSAVTQSTQVNGLSVTRVRIGPIVSVTVFDALQDKLRSVGLGEAIIVSD